MRFPRGIEEGAVKKILFWFLVPAIIYAGFFFVSDAMAGPPDTGFNHQAWTGLKPNQAGVDTVGDADGVTVSQKTTDAQTDGNATTTTTVTKTNRVNNDGSETDMTVTVTKTETTSTSEHGHDYVSDRTTTTTTTTMTVDPDKTFTKSTTRTTVQDTIPEPDEYGNPQDDAGTGTKVSSVTKTTDKRGNQTVSYTDDSGTYHESIQHPDGSTTSLTGGSGSYIGIHEAKDGSTTVTEYSGRTPDGTRHAAKVKEFDQDDVLRGVTTYDKKSGRYSKTEYPENAAGDRGNISSIETDYFQDGSIVERRVYYDDGSYDVIHYIGNHPTSKDLFDADGNREGHEIIPMEAWDDPQYAFGDGVGSEGAPLGPEIGFGGEGLVALEDHHDL